MFFPPAKEELGADLPHPSTAIDLSTRHLLKGNSHPVLVWVFSEHALLKYAFRANFVEEFKCEESICDLDT